MKPWDCVQCVNCGSPCSVSAASRPAHTCLSTSRLRMSHMRSMSGSKLRAGLRAVHKPGCAVPLFDAAVPLSW